jgi:hypothetical protein
MKSLLCELGLFEEKELQIPESAAKNSRDGYSRKAVDEECIKLDSRPLLSILAGTGARAPLSFGSEEFCIY